MDSGDQPNKGNDDRDTAEMKGTHERLDVARLIGLVRLCFKLLGWAEVASAARVGARLCSTRQ